MDVPVSITRKPGKNCSCELTRMTNMMTQLSESKMFHMKKKMKVENLQIYAETISWFAIK